MNEMAVQVCPICGLTMPLVRCPNDGSRMMEPGWIYSVLRPLKGGAVVGGRYVIEYEMATGSSSRVYMAIDNITGRSVAVKILAVDTSLDTEPVLARLVQQAQAVAGLTSVHTVTLYDIGSGVSGSFLVFELVDGRLLGEMLEKLRKKHRKMLPDAVCELAAGVLRSLAEAHEAGIVHGNVSPQHIALGHTGCGELTVKLFGFGSVRTEGGRLTRDGVTGVPAYMSPEQIKNQPVDGRSDLYALGVMLYRCVSGKLPFVGKEGYALMQQHVSEEPEALELPGEYGPSVARFIHRLLAKKPAARHRSALDALVTLQAMTGRRLHAVPHLATLDSELDDGFGDHLVDSSGNPNDFLDAKTNVYGIAPIAKVGPAKEGDRPEGDGVDESSTDEDGATFGN
jgi:eukaryotic-like serine/threonine-protein kinase